MLCVIVLSVIILSVTMLCVIVLSAIMLSVITTSVVAPGRYDKRQKFDLQSVSGPNVVKNFTAVIYDFSC